MVGLNADVKTRRLAQQRYVVSTFIVCHFHMDIGVTGCGNVRCIQLSHNRLEFVNTPIVNLLVCLFLAQHPPVGQALLIHEVSRAYKTTQHSR